MSQTVHATTISLNGLGVLLRGAPGSGKSSLALQLIEAQGSGLGQENLLGMLVSDDQTILTLKDGLLLASPPDSIAGLLELRGVGLVKVSFAQIVTLRLVVDLKPAVQIERMPEPEKLRADLLGVVLPRIEVDPNQPSAAARVRTALVAVTKDAFPL